MAFYRLVLLYSLLFLFQPGMYAQHILSSFQLSGRQGAPEVAFPFLLIDSDARAGGYGDAGAATSADANAMYWNPSKLPFTEKDAGISVSQLPWLRALVPDINLTAVSAYYKLTPNQCLGASFRYFSLGDVIAFNPATTYGFKLQTYETAYDLAYCRKLGNHFSLAVTASYFYSLFTNAGVPITQGIKPVTDLGGGVSAFYHNNELQLLHKHVVWNIGLNLSNAGPDIHYNDPVRKDTLPTMLRLGSALTMDFNPEHSLTVLADVSHLILPTHSFYNISAGLEYWNKHNFALRTGYYYEDVNSGNGNYLCLGTGFRFKGITLDFSYLLPWYERNPLENTFKVSLGYAFNG